LFFLFWFFSVFLLAGHFDDRVQKSLGPRVGVSGTGLAVKGLKVPPPFETPTISGTSKGQTGQCIFCPWPPFFKAGIMRDPQPCLG